MDFEPPEPLASYRVYDAAEVDDYVASLHATITELRAKLDSALARSQEPDRELQFSRDAEAAVGRVLVVAQRAADELLADAQEQARREAETAAERAQAMLAEASATAAGLTAQAEAVLAQCQRQAALTDEAARAAVVYAQRRAEASAADGQSSADTGDTFRGDTVDNDLPIDRRILNLFGRSTDRSDDATPRVSSVSAPPAGGQLMEAPAMATPLPIRTYVPPPSTEPTGSSEDVGGWSEDIGDDEEPHGGLPATPDTRSFAPAPGPSATALVPMPGATPGDQGSAFGRPWPSTHPAVVASLESDGPVALSTVGGSTDRTQPFARRRSTATLDPEDPFVNPTLRWRSYDNDEEYFAVLRGAIVDPGPDCWSHGTADVGDVSLLSSRRERRAARKASQQKYSLTERLAAFLGFSAAAV